MTMIPFCSGTTTINDLTATNVQSVAIGDCDLSNILLTTSCNDKTQVIRMALNRLVKRGLYAKL